MGKPAIALSLALLLAASEAIAAPQPAPIPLPSWQTAIGRTHPLAGLIYAPATREALPPEALVDRLAPADLVLLGEKHDNPDHHALQAWVVAGLAERGRRPAIVFEMLTADQAAALDQWRGSSPKDPTGLGPAVGWEASGWPPWRLYMPIAGVGVRFDLPLRAGNLSRAVLRALSRGGVAALGRDEIARLGLDHLYDADQAATLSAEIAAAHCGHAPTAHLGRMLDVQRARDASFARALVDAAASQAVLIAGAGHARRDLGVPWHLARLAPGRKVAVLAFVEVSANRLDPDHYRGNESGAPAPYDYLWFTPRLDDTDPCAKFREQLQRLHEKR